MAQIKIQTSIDQERIESLLNKIYAACRTDPNLSPRPMSELKNAYKKKNILIATYGSSIVGWVLRIPFNKICQELAAGYVVEKYRSQGVFEKLLHAALPYANSSIIVTFNYPFANYLIKKEAFKKSSLVEAVKLSKGKFLINRINLDRIKAIRNYYQTNKPIYTIYKSNE